VLKHCTPEDLDLFERQEIMFYFSNDDKFGYNFESGGNYKKIVSQETREKQSRVFRMRPPFSEEQKKHMSEAHIGTRRSKHTQEAKQKMSFAHKNISDETRIKMSESAKKRKATEETKLKMSISHKNFKHTPESRQKIIDSWKIRKEMTLGGNRD
jgi:hypothetical protein